MADNEKNQFDLNGDDSGAENTDFAEENLEAEVAENAETEDTAKSDDDSQEYSSQFDELDDYISEDNPDSSKNDIAKPKKENEDQHNYYYCCYCSCSVGYYRRRSLLYFL